VYSFPDASYSFAVSVARDPQAGVYPSFFDRPTPRFAACALVPRLPIPRPPMVFDSCACGDFRSRISASGPPRRQYELAGTCELRAARCTGAVSSSPCASISRDDAVFCLLPTWCLFACESLFLPFLPLRGPPSISPTKVIDPLPSLVFFSFHALGRLAAGSWLTTSSLPFPDRKDVHAPYKSDLLFSCLAIVRCLAGYQSMPSLCRLPLSDQSAEFFRSLF